MRYKILTEDELIHGALNGSEAHLNLLISIYEPFIMDSIAKQITNYQDVLDLRQLICWKIAKKISKNYAHQDKFESWASSIIKNEISDYFREKKKKRHVALQYLSLEVLDELADEYLMAAEEVLASTPNLPFYVDQLSAEQAVIVKLKCLQDKTFREISEMINVPINTVMGRYRYGIERIREMVTKQQ